MAGGDDQRNTKGDRWGKVLLVLLAPVVLAWTSWNFQRLWRTGSIPIREDGGVVNASSGFNFWLTLMLYALLFFGAIVVLVSFFGWLKRRF